MLKPSRRKGPRKLMTVCVAAFAAESEAIVLISDKAITRGQIVGDTAISKMCPRRFIARTVS